MRTRAKKKHVASDRARHENVPRHIHFLTEINKKNGEGYQEGTAVQQGPHFSDILLFHKEKYRGTTENMKKTRNTGKIIGKVFGEARALGVTALAAAVMLSGCGNAGNQAQKGGSGAEQTENVETAKMQRKIPKQALLSRCRRLQSRRRALIRHMLGAGEHMHEPLIQSTLTVTEADLSIGYDLATDVETSEDGMTWTVTIRDDAKFTDGEALTAEDVAFTYNTLQKDEFRQRVFQC